METWLLGATFLSIDDIKASFEAKQDPFKRQYERSALSATPETLPSAVSYDAAKRLLLSEKRPSLNRGGIRGT
jgi:hypothetical protein